MNKKGEICIGDYGKLQYFHGIGIVGGSALAVGGLFNIAKQFCDMCFLFCATTIGIAALGLVQASAALLAFYRPCMPALGFLPVDGGFGENRNIFSAEDTMMSAVFFLDLFGALMLLSASGNFVNIQKL